jgi:hypothetical protein
MAGMTWVYYIAWRFKSLLRHPVRMGFVVRRKGAMTGADKLRLTWVEDKLRLSVWTTDPGPHTWMCTR